MASTHIIINPVSAGGRTQKRLDEILDAVKVEFGFDWTLDFTRSPGEATALTQQVLRSGCNLIIAVGGDGTIQEVVNGFFSNDRLVNTKAELAVVSSGTGQGFAQSLGLTGSIAEQVAVAARGKRKLVDVGRIIQRNGTHSVRYFVNECQLGIGGAVVKTVQHNHKLFGGTIAFGAATFQTVFRHQNQSMSLRLDGGRMVSGRYTGVVIANGAFTGGGMNLAPGAVMDDGRFDIVIMNDLSIPQRLLNLPKIYNGSHVRSRHFECFVTKRLSIESDEEVLIAADGELLGTTPCEVEILQQVLPVRCSKHKGVQNNVTGL